MTDIPYSTDLGIQPCAHTAVHIEFGRDANTQGSYTRLAEYITSR